MTNLAEQSRPAPKPWAQRLGCLGVVLIMAWLLLVSVALVIRTGLFDFDSDISDSEVTAAVWAFVGTGFAAAVVLIGALFTSRYNDRTLQLAQQAEARRDANKGTGPTSAQITGSVLTLMALKHTDAARGILQAAIYEESLNAPSAAALISKFLESSNELDQNEASRLLRRAAEKWSKHGKFEWPISIRQHWPHYLTHEAKTNVLIAIGSLLSSQNREWWKGKRDWAVFLLDEAMRDDEHLTVRNGAYKLLGPLLRSLEGNGTKSLNRGGESYPLKEFSRRYKDYKMTEVTWDVEVGQAARKLEERWFPSV
jgi:hypothetical protein